MDREVSHCPLCGDEVEPYHAVEKRGQSRAVVECASHGDLEVTVSDQ